MSKPFKLRYVHELAGAFVMLSVIVLIAAAVFSGFVQGWFDGVFEVKARFDSSEKMSLDEGSLGLKEGSEVVVLNTPAGRVQSVSPDEQGVMIAVLKIKKRFRPFISKGSTGIVKKKLQLTGDSFIQIIAVKGDPLGAGDYIYCKKDEEIIETAKAMMANMEQVVVPMMDEVQLLLLQVNMILRDVTQAKGLAGTIVSDPEFTGQIKTILERSSNLALNADQAVKEANLAIKESRTAINETTRLVKGAQNHWLMRKYVQAVPVNTLTIPVFPQDDFIRNRTREEGAKRLEEAYVSNEPDKVAVAAFILSTVVQDSSDRMGMLSAIKCSGSDPVLVECLLAAAGIGSINDPAEARKTMELISNAKSIAYNGDIKAQCIMQALSEMASKPFANEMAGFLVKARGRVLESDSARIKALCHVASARYAHITGKGDKGLNELDAAESILKNSMDFLEMSNVLVLRGDYLKEKGLFNEASLQYYRAGRCMYHSGSEKGALSVLEKANACAHSAEDTVMSAEIFSLITEITSLSPAKKTP